MNANLKKTNAPDPEILNVSGSICKTNVDEIAYASLVFEKKIIEIRELIFEEYDEVKNNSSILIILSFVFIVFIIFEFLSLNLSNYFSKNISCVMW